MSFLQLIELDISPSELDLDQELVQKTDQESDQDEGKDQESDLDQYPDQDLESDLDSDLDSDHICTSLKLCVLSIICISSNWLTNTKTNK